MALLLASVLGAACNFGGVEPAPSDVVAAALAGPVPPTTPPNETFNGSVALLSDTVFNTFTTTQTGEIDVTLASTAPLATARVLLGLGSPTADGARCQMDPRVEAFVQPSLNLAVPAITLPAGPYCVAVEDQFRAAPFTYVVNVWHK